MTSSTVRHPSPKSASSWMSISARPRESTPRSKMESSVRPPFETPSHTASQALHTNLTILAWPPESPLPKAPPPMLSLEPPMGFSSTGGLATVDFFAKGLVIADL